MAGGSDAGAPRVTAKIDATNYLQWSYEMEHTLRYRGLWGLLAPVGSTEAEPILNGPLRSGEGAPHEAAEPHVHEESTKPTENAGSADDKAMMITRAAAAAERQAQGLEEQDARTAQETAVTRQEKDMREGQACAFVMMHIKADHVVRLCGVRTA